MAEGRQAWSNYKFGQKCQRISPVLDAIHLDTDEKPTVALAQFLLRLVMGGATGRVAPPSVGA